MLSWLGCFPFFANCVPFPVFSLHGKEAAGTVGVAERQGMPSRGAAPTFIPVRGYFCTCCQPAPAPYFLCTDICTCCLQITVRLYI